MMVPGSGSRLRRTGQRPAGGTALAILPLTASLLLGGFAGAALAQPAPVPPRQEQPPLPPAPPEQVEPTPRPPRSGGPASNDAIDEQTGIPRGVIRPPPGVDPGIQAPVPVPMPNTTPVIPPPGTPGGDPRVQPR
jgi:hypothetical protein